SGRRIASPQAPPVTWWSIATAMHPSAIPAQKRKAKRYERKNWSGWKKPPTAQIARVTAPTRSAGRWNRSRAWGS
ncbi:MAG: hypothetical protein ABI610_10400, partial [Acidobacteriota bacterium]